MPKRDAFAAIPTEELLALGSDVVPMLLQIVEARADARDTTFTAVARRLPEPWKQIVLAAHALEGMEETECFAGAFYDLRRERDVQALEHFFRGLGCDALADALADAREHTSVLVDEDMDPLDLEELRDIRAEQLDLPRARAALTAHAKRITIGFPAA